MVNQLTIKYNSKKSAIKKRLKEFREVWQQPDRRIFSELCFCICTPQSKAVYCDKAISGLEKSGVLFKGGVSQIKAGLKAVRFPNNKAKYIAEAQDFFTEKGKIRIKNKINTRDIQGAREWLVKNVKGIGLKEASHFLRNIGLGEDLAILDVHILKNMVMQGVIKEVPKTITKTKYIAFEEKLKQFSEKLDIPMGELDLLFWSNQTGQIFK